MISFSQWWKAYQKSGKVFSHYYLLGTERVLIDEVKDTIMSQLTPHPWNVRHFVVGVIPEDEIWTALHSASLDGESVVSVVYGVDQLKNRYLIPSLVKQKSPKHTIIFVSNEEKIEKVREDSEQGAKYVLPAFLQGFEPKGKIVECSAFTQNTAKTAVEWIKTKVRANDGALVHLLNESNGDLRVIRDVLQKLVWLQETATVRTINVFLQSVPSESFTEALVQTNKKEAMRALPLVQESEYLQIIGHLDAQVDLVGKIHDRLMQHKQVGEIMKEMGSQAFLVPGLSKVAKQYSRERRARIRKALAEADRRLRRGINDGVMEALIMVW